MSEKNKLRKQMQAQAKHYAPNFERVKAFLGDADGVVDVPGREGYVYARLWTGETKEVYNQSGCTTAMTPVWVGYTDIDQNHLRVLGPLDIFSDPLPLRVPRHAATHAATGRDALWIWADQYLPWRVSPVTGMTVRVYPQPFFYNGVYKKSTRKFIDIDLSSSVPGTSGTRWVRICAGSETAGKYIDVINGDITPSKTNFTYVEPPTGSFWIAAYALTYGQTTLSKDYYSTDFIDLRFTGQGGLPTFTPKRIIYTDPITGVPTVIDTLQFDDANSEIVQGAFHRSGRAANPNSLQIGGQASSNVFLQAIGASFAPFVTGERGGNIDVDGFPTAVLKDYILLRLRGRGYDAPDVSGSTSTEIRLVADENHATGAHGTRIEIYTTPNGTNILTKVLTVQSDGNVNIETGKDYLINGAQVVPVETHAATSKTTPADDDEIPLIDSAVSWVLKKLTWANIKATLASVFLKLDQTTPQTIINGVPLMTTAVNDAGSANQLVNKAYIDNLALSTLYLDTTASLADNFTLSTAPSVYAETANAKSTTSVLTFFERFVSMPVGRTSIPAGTWEFNIFGATSSDVGSNLIKFRVNKRVMQTGMTGAFTGAGATRTFTVTGGTPFTAGDANASQLLAGLIETPTQTAWISTFTSSSVVTVTLTDPGFINVAGVALNAIYYYLFDASTAELAGATPALYTVLSVQPAFSVNQTDRIVIALFCLNNTGTHTITLYYGGSINFTHFHTTFSLFGASGIADVPSDNVYYGRRNAAWTNLKTYFDTLYQATGAYLTSVTADAPLSGSGTAGSHLVMADASAAVKGSMSAADFRKLRDVRQRVLQENMILADGECWILSGYINLATFTLTLNGDSRLEIL